MKKKISLLAVLLLATCVTAYSVSGTYAKYTSSKDLTDTARVAKWDIKLGTESLWSSTASFNLFNYTDSNVDVDGADNNSKVIAPGTTGTIALPKITNASEVTASYSISLAVTNDSGIPLEFSTDGSHWYSTSDIASTKVTGSLAMGATQTNATSIQWRWAFERGADAALEANDGDDTALGIDGDATVTVEATITATQVD